MEERGVNASDLQDGLSVLRSELNLPSRGNVSRCFESQNGSRRTRSLYLGMRPLVRMENASHRESALKATQTAWTSPLLWFLMILAAVQLADGLFSFSEWVSIWT